jgi:hypothetical protein
MYNMNRGRTHLVTSLDPDLAFSTNQLPASAGTRICGRVKVRRSPHPPLEEKEDVEPINLKKNIGMVDKKIKKSKLLSPSRSKSQPRTSEAEPNLGILHLIPFCDTPQFDAALAASELAELDLLPDATEQSLLDEPQPSKSSRPRSLSVPLGLPESIHSIATQDASITTKNRIPRVVQQSSPLRDSQQFETDVTFETNEEAGAIQLPLPEDPLLLKSSQSRSVPRGQSNSLHSTKTRDSIAVTKKRLSRSPLRLSPVPDTEEQPLPKDFQFSRSSQSRSAPRGRSDSLHATKTRDSIAVKKKTKPRSPLRLSPVPDTKEQSLPKDFLFSRSSRSRSVPRGLSDSLHATKTRDSIAVTKQRMSRSPLRLSPVPDTEEQPLPKDFLFSRLSQSRSVPRGRSDSLHSTASQDSIARTKKRMSRSPPRLSLPSAAEGQPLSGGHRLSKSSRSRSVPRGPTESLHSITPLDYIGMTKKRRSRSVKNEHRRSRSFGMDKSLPRLDSAASSPVFTQRNTICVGAPKGSEQPSGEFACKEPMPSVFPKPLKQMPRGARARSLPHHLAAIPSPGDSIDEIPRQSRSRSFQRSKGKSKSGSRSASKSRSLSHWPDTQSKLMSVPQKLKYDEKVSTSDDDRLTEIKEFFRKVKQAHAESMTVPSPEPPVASGDKPSERKSSPKSRRTDPFSESKSVTSNILVEQLQISSDDSSWTELKAQLLQHPVPDFCRARTVSLGAKPAIDHGIQKDHTRFVSPYGMMRCQDSTQNYLQIMKADECSSDDDSISATALLMLLDGSPELELFGQSSDDDSIFIEQSNAPEGLMNPKELLAFLVADNEDDLPEQKGALCSELNNPNTPQVMTLAEMADILNHVATRHGNNDVIRWDIISRMAFRDAENDGFAPLRPVENVGGDAGDYYSDASSISVEGIDKTTDFWNSGGSF